MTNAAKACRVFSQPAVRATAEGRARRGHGFAAFWAALPHRRQGKVGAERRSVERSWVGRPNAPPRLFGGPGGTPGERVTFLGREAEQKLT